MGEDHKKPIILVGNKVKRKQQKTNLFHSLERHDVRLFNRQLNEEVKLLDFEEIVRNQVKTSMRKVLKD